LDAPQRPSFHEIKGLGGRVYEEFGMSKDDIQRLMTHADKKTTEIYLDKGPDALTDDDYVTVKAPMRLLEVMKLVA